MDEEKLKLEYFLDFYNKYKDDHIIIKEKCPFENHDDEILAFTNVDCTELCYDFEELVDVLNINCPCHAFGSEEALERLGTLLINRGLLEEDE
jgi:hypothetical protein